MLSPLSSYINTCASSSSFAYSTTQRKARVIHNSLHLIARYQAKRKFFLSFFFLSKILRSYRRLPITFPIGRWQFNLLYLLFVKVEFEASFMSEQASLFLSSVGLLGEYCPISRKKNRHSSGQFACMHIAPNQGYFTQCQGCRFMRPFPFSRNLCGIEEETVNTRDKSAAFLSSF